MWEILIAQDIWTACKTPKQWKGAHVGVIDQSCRSWVLSYVRSPLAPAYFYPINLHGCWPCSFIFVSNGCQSSVTRQHRTFCEVIQMWYTPDWGKTLWDLRFFFPKALYNEHCRASISRLLNTESIRANHCAVYSVTRPLRFLLVEAKYKTQLSINR